MKPIELTKKQKSKLLEMCNKLFLFDFEISKNNIKIFNIEGTHHTTIHWFEFCFRYLVKAIQNKLPDELVWRKKYACAGGGKWTLYSHFLYIYPKNFLSEHPIDWLYNEFKQIN